MYFAVNQFVNTGFDVIHQQYMQYSFFAVEVFINSSFGNPRLFGYFVNAGFMIAELAEKLLRCPFYAFLYFIGFHLSVSN